MLFIAGFPFSGILNAFDGRNDTSNGKGIGGLLQAATYFSALSGGSWFLTSLYQSNFPTMHDLVFGTQTGNGYSGYDTSLNVIAPSDNATVVGKYWAMLIGELDGKHAAGFPGACNETCLIPFFL